LQFWQIKKNRNQNKQTNQTKPNQTKPKQTNNQLNKQTNQTNQTNHTNLPKQPKLSYMAQNEGTFLQFNLIAQQANKH
jgi:hypothetical protein